MKTAWTPGPWIAQKGEDNEGFCENVWGTVKSSDWYLARVWSDCGDSGKEAEANARLMAAAPDLYDALFSLMQENKALNLKCLATDVERKALAALAKARGE